MDPITLHFHVFQAGAEGNKTQLVENPQTTKILDLKKQLFSEELERNKSIRFIACGRILDDSSPLSNYKLGTTAHIQVSISDSSPLSRPSPAPMIAKGNTSTIGPSVTSASVEKGPAIFSNMFYLGAVAFVSTGSLLYLALMKRRQFSLQITQLVFIGVAVWMYLLVCHGFPALFQALRGFANSMSPPTDTSKNMPTVSTRGSSIPVAAQDEVSTAAASPAAGLSVMTPTLPSGGDASSILTQRR